MHCPTGDIHAKGKCWCDQNQNFGKLDRGNDVREAHSRRLTRLRVVFLPQEVRGCIDVLLGWFWLELPLYYQHRYSLCIVTPHLERYLCDAGYLDYY